MYNVDELNRIKEYRQIKKEVRRSDKFLLVGIDIGKINNYAFYGTATGKTLKRRLVFGYDFSGIEMLMDIANCLAKDNSLEYFCPCSHFPNPKDFFLRDLTVK